MTSEPVRVPAEGFLEGRLQAVLDVESVDGIVRHYLQGSSTTGFAGRLFDTLGKNSCGEISADDVAAVSLLDVRFGPRALHALVEQNAADDLLALVPDEVDLWEAEVEDLRSLRNVFDALRRLDGVGRTKASKLLARKRPRLAPITDSVVESVLSTRGWDHLEAMASVLKNRAIVDRMEALADGEVSPLRALDIAIWMVGSRSRAARTVRQEHGVSAEPLVFGEVRNG